MTLRQITEAKRKERLIKRHANREKVSGQLVKEKHFPYSEDDVFDKIKRM